MFCYAMRKISRKRQQGERLCESETLMEVRESDVCMKKRESWTCVIECLIRIVTRVFASEGIIIIIKFYLFFVVLFFQHNTLLFNFILFFSHTWQNKKLKSFYKGQWQFLPQFLFFQYSLNSLFFLKKTNRYEKSWGK